MIEIRTLETVTFEEIVTCFLQAFEGYFVKMPEDPAYYFERWQAAGVRYDLSFGAFSKGKLVAFILHCIDRRYGQKIAFNTGTGVIPEFRGNRIISAIYYRALPILSSQRVNRSRLEVIKKNLTAISIYRKTGFRVVREYKCFQGAIKSNTPPAILKKVGVTDLNWETIPNQERQSWDHQRNSLVNGPYNFYQVWIDDMLIGLVALNQDFSYLALAEITTQIPQHWDHLIAGVAALTTAVKINNVDHELVDKIEALARAGLTNTIDQYEMELVLN
jgi:ribosomal protein S18 acetylase RimI-like enzyme